MLVLGFSIALEVLLFLTSSGWKIRLVLAAFIIFSAMCASSGLLLSSPNTISVLLFVTTCYRVFNLFRLIKSRMHEQYLFKATVKSSRYFFGATGLLILIWFITNKQSISVDTQLFALTLAQLATALIILISTIKNLRKMAYRPSTRTFADRDLPTITVAIPARNETADLEACLQTIIASDYPKLEILVLDDCSQDRTPEIIRDYAHDGVRFLSGSEPRNNWLAKNQAYDQLAQAASGDFILFCGVDVRFGIHTIRALTTHMVEKNKAMVSIMPTRAEQGLHLALIQPMRYWWEVALPRKLFNRPPVLSTCWIISRKVLQKKGGMEAVSHSIIPEAYFARVLIGDDKYGFIRSNAGLQLQTVKGWRDQFDTAVRVRYPEIRRRPELVLLLSVLESSLLLGPFVLFIYGIFTPLGFLHPLAAVTCILLIFAHVLIVMASNPANGLLSLINYPLVVLTEIALGNYSMWKYEFSVVEWKGRNICLPVMHAFPHLPNIAAENK